jgi:hypothetical protein
MGQPEIKAVKSHKLLNGDETFKASEGWLWRWEFRQGTCQFHTESESAYGESVAAEHFSDTL